MKNKGFTLIELLAVIIILGILMLIAIPSVSQYITSSRKEGYIVTAHSYIQGATNIINKGNMDIYDSNTSYYIPISCIKLESGGDSPFGKFKDAYVIANYNGDGYDYYWVSADVAGNGILITREADLSASRIRTGVKEVVTTEATDGRYNVKVMDKTDCKFANGDGTTATNRFGELHFVDLEKYDIHLDKSFNFDDLESFDIYTRDDVTGPYVLDVNSRDIRNHLNFTNSPMGDVIYMGKDGGLRAKAFAVMPTVTDKKTGEEIKATHFYTYTTRKVNDIEGEKYFSFVCHFSGTGKQQGDCWEKEPVKLSYCRKTGSPDSCTSHVEAGQYIELANGDALDISRNPPMRWHTLLSGYHNSGYCIDSFVFSRASGS